MSNVINLDDYRKIPDNYFVCLAMCVQCAKRWVGTIPHTAPLTQLQCPQCGACDSFASVMPREFTECFQK